MKNVIIIPSWIQRLFKAEQLSIKDVLDFNKLCELMNTGDIRALIALQSHGPFAMYQVTDSDSSALLSAWQRNSKNFLSDTYVSTKEITVDKLVTAANDQVDKDYLQSLISAEVRNQDSEKAFEVIPGDQYTLLLVLKDGYFGAQDYEVQDINVIENIIRVLYGEFAAEDVAQTTIFKRYVDLLSKKNT